MDKSLAYVVARSAAIAIPAFWIVTASEEIDPEASISRLREPARSGSSFGVSKVFREEELETALETAGRYDSKVLIEEAVVGMEVGCAVFGNEAELTVGAIDRVVLSHGFFRIHQEEEPEGGSETRHSSSPLTFRPRPARWSWRQRRPCIEPWGAGDGPGGHVPQEGGRYS